MTRLVPRLVRALATLAVVLLPATGLAFVASPASATSTTLCTGYAACTKLGMSAHGYRKVDHTMFWRMYSGHNCTNYAAFRMVDSGMPNVRPWSGGGNATFWGTENPDITDGIPAVGAVAWWKANVKPAGSAGHVAYVEQVISPDEIIVSQDSWGGDFSWARITRAGGSWPSGFVHFNDVDLTNTARPAVSGTAKVGAVLTASPGTWSPGGASYTYQWRSGGEIIPGATAPTYKIKLAQQGQRVAVRVTATKLGFPSHDASSTLTPAVLPGVITNTVAPVISGTPVVDGTLTASAGTWSPAPTSLTYQWSADDQPIAGATAARLKLDATMVGKQLSVAVKATREGYVDVTSRATASALVAPGTLTQTRAPVLTGEPRLGATLSVDPGAYSPAGSAVIVRWIRDGVWLPDTGLSTYTLTAADLGTRLQARVAVVRPGYTTLAARTPSTARVLAVSRLQIQASSPHPGRARFDLTVTAPGVDQVTGIVRIRAEGKVVAEVTLRRGVGHAVLTGLPAGRATYTLRFLGGETLTATVPVTRTVRIS
ncbi:CHAP domain-containing protein [Nocardioides sp.]|uniref:CHAP domain-containing protein n=1 Tax=Nocardioides sp. TaxID=35761 RepID=UPI003D0DDA47